MADKPQKKPQTAKLSRSTRIIGYVLTFAALFLGFGYLTLQLYKLQVVDGDYWRSLASEQQLKDTTL